MDYIPTNGNGESNGHAHDEHADRPVCGEAWLEIVKPRDLKAKMSVCLLDDGRKPSNVFRADVDATATFEIELIGELWECACGVICVDMEFVGYGGGFRLSDLLGEALEIPFDGAKDLNPKLQIEIPAGTLPVNKFGSYVVSSTAIFRNTAGKFLTIGGGVPLGTITVFNAVPAGV